MVSDDADDRKGSAFGSFLGRLFGERNAAPRETADPSFALPDGLRVYAVGDVHGHVELLEKLQTLIDRDRAERPAERVIEIYLGDYVDRGPASADVIETLAADAPEGIERICLAGNHEDYLTGFLEDKTLLHDWLDNGGIATLASYGVEASPVGADPDVVHAEFEEALPRHHQAFLSGLKLWHRIGGVLFVHAGIRPGVDLENQDPFDLKWIRTPFLHFEGPLPMRVVHGHTPVREPYATPYRIGIDTGAFATGVLTAAVLEGTDVRFLST